MKMVGKSLVMAAIAMCISQTVLGFPIHNWTKYKAWIGGNATFGNDDTVVEPGGSSRMGSLQGQAAGSAYTQFNGALVTPDGTRISLRSLNRPAHAPGYPRQIIIRQDPDGSYAIHDADEDRWAQMERDAIEKERRELEALRKQRG